MTTFTQANLTDVTHLPWSKRILTRTIILTLAVSLIPLILVGVATTYFVGRDAEQEAEKKLLDSVDAIAKRINIYFTTISEDMEFIVLHADRDDFVSKMNRRLISTFTTSHHDIQSIWVVDNEGQKSTLFSRSEMVLTGQTDTHSYSRPPDLQDNGLVWHGTVQDVFGEQFAVASIPIKKPWQTRSVGIMFFKIRLEGVQNAFNLYMPEGVGQAFIVNDSGQLIAHTDRSQVLSGADVSHHTEVKLLFEKASEDFRSYLYLHSEPGMEIFMSAYKRIPSMDWGIVVEENITDVYRMRDRLIWLTAGGFIAVTLLVIPLAVLFSYRLTNPIGQLMKTATDLAEGKPNSRAEVRTQGEIGVFAETFNMMVDIQQKIGMELAEEKERLLVTLRSIGDAVIATDTDGKILLLNKVAEELTGWDNEHAVGRPLPEVFNIINENTREQCLNPVEKVLETGIVVGLANHTALVARDGSEKSIADSGAPIRDKDGNIVGVVLVFRDITEKRLAEEKIKQSEQFNKLLLNSTAEAIYGVDTSGLCTFVNPSCLKMLGYKNEADLLGKNMHDLMHHTKQDGSVYLHNDCKICSAYKTGEGVHIDDEAFWRANGTSFHVEYWSYPITQEGKIKGAVVTFLDITQRKDHEGKIIKSLKEKEVLLKEVHHRVKNNMAVINALLSLQASYIEDPDANEKFIETQNRIRAMALVHDKLYAAEDFSTINFSEYVETLSRHISGTMGDNFDIDIDIAPFDLEPDTLIPCGLLINEVLTNSFKHAFDGSNDKKITLTANRNDNGTITLVIKDNGKGLPEGFDMSRSTGLGLKLIDSLLTQLHGTVEVKNEGGAVFFFSFPEKIKFAGRA
jgi:PAS domain S-box-containing protein